MGIDDKYIKSIEIHKLQKESSEHHNHGRLLKGNSVQLVHEGSFLNFSTVF